MEVLINITEKEGKQLVSARELYDHLGLDKSNWKRWYEKNILKNDFAIENQDYEGFVIMTSSNNKSHTMDFALTIDFAKKICMMARTEKGEQVRQYFIACEKQLQSQMPQAIDFSNPNTVLQMVQNWATEQEKRKLAEAELAQAHQTLQIQQPKVLFAQALEASRHTILIGELAKLLKQNGLDIGQNRLFDYLREHSYLIKKGEQRNLPTQRALELELFEVKTRSISNPDGSIHVTKTTKVTPKGQIYFVNKLLSQYSHSA